MSLEKSERILKYKIVKSNKLINSRNSFSLIQHRIILLMFARMKKGSEKFEWMEIPIKQVLGIKEGGRVKGAQYRQVKEAAIQATQSAIYVEENGRWRSIPFIQADGVDHANVIRMKFVEEARDLVLNLSGGYTDYLLKNVYTFKSPHSIRIYELMAQYFPKIRVREMEIKHFKELLSLEKNYSSFSKLKKYVLDKAVDEINELSDLYLEYEVIRAGRTPKRLYFTINRQNPKNEEDTQEVQTIDVSHQEVKSNDMGRALKTEEAFSMEKKSFIDEIFYRKLITKYSKELLDYSIEKIEALTNVMNKRGYLIKALKENYYQEELFALQRKESEKERKRTAGALKKQQKFRAEEITTEYDSFRQALLDRYYKKLSEDDMEEFNFDFEDSDNAIERRYVKELQTDQPSRIARNFIARWLVMKYGSSEDQLMLEIKNYALKNHDFDFSKVE